MNKRVIAGLVGILAGASLVLPQLAHADEAAPGPAYPANCPTGVTVMTITDGTLPPTTVPPVPEDPDSVGVAVCTGGLPTSGFGFDGGAVAAGATLDNGPTRVCVPTGPTSVTAVPTPIPVGVYVIADGNDVNTLSNSSGYIGVSNYESSPSSPQKNSTCPTPGSNTTPNDGDGTNSGGYVGVKEIPAISVGPASTTIPAVTIGVYLPVPFVACGFTSGPYYGTAGRDGCAIP
jgi:hypothetical protein